VEAKVKNEVLNYLSQRKGDYSLYYEDLKTGEKLKYNEKDKFLAASVIKITIMIEYFRQLEVDMLKEDELITVLAEKKVGGSGVLKELRDNIEITLAELVVLMIVSSDNTATNLLIDKLGFDNINDFLKNRNYESTLKRKMMDYDSREKGIENYIRADEIGEILKNIYNHNFEDISQKSSEEMLSILKRQQYRSQLSFYFPEKLHNNIASKTGTLDKVQHDASIFDFENEKYILVVFSKNLPSNAYGSLSLANIAKIISKEV